MNQNAIKTLEYDKIKEKIMGFAITEQGKEHIRKLTPAIDLYTIEGWMEETTEARAIIDKSSSIPLHSLTGIDRIIEKLSKVTVLLPEELSAISELLQSVRLIKRFMKTMDAVAPKVSNYALSFYELEDLCEEINHSIVNGRVDDNASNELSKIRKRMAVAEDRIKGKLESILKSAAFSSYIQDGYISTRNGRFVIPIKREAKKYVEGTVLDTSSSGNTLFIEPAGIRSLQDDLNLFKIEEEKEEYRILSTLTAVTESYRRELCINIETISHYDFLFAKAKYSRSIKGCCVELNNRNKISLIGAKHPLIGDSAVPLDFNIGEEYRALLITGPNTGGKTVVLKTVGLLTMMAQSGLHIPAQKGSTLAVYRDILADIGDGQSIEQSLSTFSSHIKNISSIMQCADKHSLVIIDELGAGTDPSEGMGLAIAVLENVFGKQATVLATTHYSEIKVFANHTPGFKNACMEFDINSLRPLYKLKIGTAGESNAFLIALRLGVDKNIIERAHEITYKEKKTYDYDTIVREMQKYAKASATIAPLVDKEVINQHQENKILEENTLKARTKAQKQQVVPSFKVGDCVHVSSMGRTGVVCEPENSKGDVGVMIMRKKFVINKKRLSLYIDSKEMYPDQYDFDIVFETKENRKKKNLMEKKYVKGLTIEVK